MSAVGADGVYELTAFELNKVCPCCTPDMQGCSMDRLWELVNLSSDVRMLHLVVQGRLKSHVMCWQEILQQCFCF